MPDADTLTGAAHALTAALPMVALEAERHAAKELGDDLGGFYARAWADGYRACIDSVRGLGEDVRAQPL